MNKYVKLHPRKTQPVKGGLDPIQRALSEDELDAQLRSDIDKAEKHAAERITANKKACDDRRAKRIAEQASRI